MKRKCICVHIKDGDKEYFKITLNEIYYYALEIHFEDMGEGNWNEVEYCSIYTLDDGFVVSASNADVFFKERFKDLYEWRREKIEKLFKDEKVDLS